MDEELTNLIWLIRVRTTQGLDIDERPFAPYSPAYEEFKGQSLVDLTLTGKMLADIRYKLDRKRAVIYFASAESEEKANTLETGQLEPYFLPPRPFFGMTDPDINYFVERIADNTYEQFSS